MGDVFKHPTWWKTPPTQPPEPPDMELIKRVEHLETDVTEMRKDILGLKTDVAVIKSNYATKADVLEAKNSVIMWVVAAIFMAQLLPMLKDFIATTHTPAADQKAQSLQK